MSRKLFELRDGLFRALMFEADAERFRAAGIRMGADQTDVETKLMEEVLSPFAVGLRNEAMRMTRLYALVYCFENSVRELIRERLEEKYGAEWWAKVPNKVQEFSEKRQQDAKVNSWLEGSKDDPLEFCQFAHLANIITENWDDFRDLIPTQHWLKQRMEELEQARNFIAHNRLLLPGEFQRIETYIGDWNRQVGV